MTDTRTTKRPKRRYSNEFKYETVIRFAFTYQPEVIDVEILDSPK